MFVIIRTLVCFTFCSAITFGQQLHLDSRSAYRGETIDLSLHLQTDKPLAYLEAALDFNEEHLEVLEVFTGSLLDSSNMDASGSGGLFAINEIQTPHGTKLLRMAWIDLEGSPGEAEWFTIRFQVDPQVEVGEIPIRIVEVSALDAGENELQEMDVEDGSVTVKSKSANFHMKKFTEETLELEADVDAIHGIIFVERSDNLMDWETEREELVPVDGKILLELSREDGNSVEFFRYRAE